MLSTAKLVLASWLVIIAFVVASSGLDMLNEPSWISIAAGLGLIISAASILMAAINRVFR